MEEQPKYDTPVLMHCNQAELQERAKELVQDHTVVLLVTCAPCPEGEEQHTVKILRAGLDEPLVIDTLVAVYPLLVGMYQGIYQMLHGWEQRKAGEVGN
jgi:hypothetical protein